jgi:folate-binding protein YgfZ
MTDAEQARREAEALSQSAGLRVLDDVAALAVSGDDARSWLNGQVTNDVGQSQPGDAVYALVLSLKGKVLTDLWILDRGESFLLLLPADRREAIAKHFDGFIIMEDVELDPEDDVRVLTVQGPGCAEAVQNAGATEHAWPCDRLGIGGRDVVVPAASADSVRASLEQAVQALGGMSVGPRGWELARIRQGRPRYGVDFGDWTLPQEAGLKQRAIAFGKGCYQGQEPVVMLEHRGKPPKRLAQLELTGEQVPEPGTTIENAEGRRLGQVTSAQLDPSTPGRIPALGYVKRAEATEGNVLRTGGQDATIRTLVGP